MQSALDTIVTANLHDDIGGVIPASESPHHSPPIILSLGSVVSISAGGGAFKYANQVKSLTRIVFEPYDELECMVRGLIFLIQHISDELYVLRNANFT